MDELQARIRTRRSLQTEMNLAKQPYPEFDHSDGDQTQGEANVVEMPHRQVQRESASEQVQLQPSTAKRKQGTAKRKPTAAQKAFPFRQMRDGHQQPYIDELKRLEAQAERINQLLAERKRKKAQADLSGGLATNATVETETLAPKKKATKGSKPPTRSPQREVPLMPAQDDDTEALEAQAERIKQLLQELEIALVEEETMPPQGASDRSPTRNHPLASSPPTAETQPSPGAGVESVTSGTYRYAAGAPLFMVSQTQTMPEADQKAQQEATETAQALRYLANREVSREPVSRESIEPAIHGGSTHHESRRDAARSRDRAASSPSSVHHYGFRLRQMLQIPQASFDKVGDAVLWIVLAAAIRVGARALLTMLPALTPLFLLLMFAPAALAVYLAMFVPKAGFVSIYRLFLVMLGLLLGGRLF